MYEMVQAILTSGEKTDLRQLLGELRSEESVTSCGMKFCKLWKLLPSIPKASLLLPSSS